MSLFAQFKQNLANSAVVKIMSILQDDHGRYLVVSAFKEVGVHLSFLFFFMTRNSINKSFNKEFINLLHILHSVSMDCQVHV